jgi:hypothetical protein
MRCVVAWPFVVASDPGRIENTSKRQWRRNDAMKTESMQVLMKGLLCSALLAMLALTSLAASAQTRNLLFIHGRTNSSGEQFGALTQDQIGAWGTSTTPVVTTANVYYVQWDAWNRYFDDMTCPGGGCEILNALNSLCSRENNQMCWIVCHSAGCAALESVFAKVHGSASPPNIAHVIAASSAAGGSELADNGLLRYIGGLTGLSSTIDNSLKTSYARGAYNHNNMVAAIRAISGTSNDTATEVLTSCNFWPQQSGPYNSDCTACFHLSTLSNWHQCDDGVVALHSTCGHNRVASFQDCNSTISPYTDTAGTYEWHGWWIADSGFQGPYSPYGQSHYNAGQKTFRVDHSDGKVAAVNEYNYCPSALCP